VQALVLTAIVIGFGTTAFALVLTFRLYEEHGTIDLDDVAGSDGRDEGGPGSEPGPGAGGESTPGAGSEPGPDGGVSADD
jgi:multicomponent Na+:H+ antiporter subunit C